MKIALIIFRIGPSHGSILQTYALNKVLVNMGHDVTIIDRQPPIKIVRDSMSLIKRLLFGLLGKYKGPIFYLGAYSNTSMKELFLFISKHLSPSMKTIRSEAQVLNLNNEGYQAYIVGSDQTWRPKFVYNIYYYYLDFLQSKNKVKRIAYASSFGTSDWEYNPKETLVCKDLAMRFDAISVRENDGVNLCKTYFGVEASHVLDPTMLLTKQDYMALFDSKEEVNKYIAFSLLDINSFYTESLDKISAYYNLPIKRLNSRSNDIRSKNDCIEPSIEAWLSGIYNAEFVVTDSFHATVFCIIFNKPFITLINSRRGISRISSLLGLFGLNNRCVKNICDIEKLQLSNSIVDIDWNNVNVKLSLQREYSLNWLKTALLDV